MNLENPIRYPDTTSTVVMNKRAWWLVLLGVLVPGASQSLAGNRRLGRAGLISTFSLWLIGVLLIALNAIASDAVIAMFANGFVLLVVQWILIAYAVFWLILALNTLVLVRLVKLTPRTRPAVAMFAIAMLVLTSGGVAYAASLLGSTRSLLSDIFVAAPPVDPIDGHYNFVLIGGDAGVDRDGLRPDSVTVVSVDAETGQALMVGIPRELEFAPFPETSPMFAIHPNGYARDICEVDVCKFNSIYTDVEVNHADLYPDAEARGSSPGLDAVMEAASGVTGLPVQFYVLIDMQGFSDMVDALGGVDITVTERVGLAEAGYEGEPLEWIETGEQHMDGYHALWYARTRWNTSDYDRMKRQRQIQEAILKQFSPMTIITKFKDIAAAGAQVVRTDIPEGMVAPLVSLAKKTVKLPIKTVELIPENGIDPEFPDYELIHQMVADANAPPPPPTETPSSN